MLPKRIIPCLDVKDGRVVKGVNFAGLQDIADPVEQAAYYDREGPMNWSSLISAPLPKGGRPCWIWWPGRQNSSPFPSP